MKDTIPSEIDPHWAWHYRALVAARKQLLAEAAERSREAAESTGEVDSADRATDQTEHELSVALLASEERTLSEIDAAIDRMRRGVYGLCEDTGQPIPPGRLKAVPWCRTTADAEKVRERGKRLS